MANYALKGPVIVVVAILDLTYRLGVASREQHDYFCNIVEFQGGGVLQDFCNLKA